MSKAIASVGGEPLDWIRRQLEADIGSFFARQKLDEKQIALYKKVSAAAYELSEALEDLAELGKVEAKQNEFLAECIMHSDVYAKLKFAKQVRKHAEGADWTLDKGFGVHGEAARGRPTDTAVLSWSSQVLAVARAERWATEDDRGRTSVEFMDLLVELAGCARAVGLDHTRDIRRALTRAIAMARAEAAEELRNRQRVNEALDAIVSPEQRMAVANPICLCGAGKKSD